ncbi:MAG: ABC transporter permease [Halothece sp.]
MTYSRLRLILFNFWTVGILLIALLIATPILFILTSIFADTGEIWQHLVATVLSEYVKNALILMVGVGLGVLIIGVGTAWLLTRCQFWGSNILEWALLLPLATPAYLLAYTYTHLLDFFGPVQTTLRSLFGWVSVNDYWFPEIRNIWGAIAMLTLALYPYVYLLVRVAFTEQAGRLVEASRSLGCNPWLSFIKVALPLARPAIASGVALVLMETLGDFGTVQYFGVTTFTTGIYRTWFGMGERVAAAQLSVVLLLFIAVLIVLERLSRRQAQYYESVSSNQPPPPYQLPQSSAIAAFFFCTIPLMFGFIIPVAYLGYLTVANAEYTLNQNFWDMAQHSLILGGISAILASAIALFLGYGQRQAQGKTFAPLSKGNSPFAPLSKGGWGDLNIAPIIQNGINIGVRIAALGYAIPGTVIAVGILIPLTQLDQILDRWMRSTFDISTGLLFSGTITALVFAYLVRFLAVAFNTVESSLTKIKPSLDEASRSLGHNLLSTLLRIHLPLMWGGTLTAVMLVFVDVMKELPATLILRPFNFDTLAVKVYEYASDERLIEAAAPALTIILVGIIPVIFLSWRITATKSPNRD